MSEEKQITKWLEDHTEAQLIIKWLEAHISKLKKKPLKKLLVLLVILNSSCGASDSQPSPAATPSEKSQTQGSQHAPSQTLALDNASKAPDCTQSNESQLIYLKAEKVFRVCTSLTWQDIDISGKEGIAGNSGAVGPQGAVGAAGPQGAPGKDLRSNYWVDPITGITWYQGSYTSYPASTCGTGYHHGSFIEIDTAYKDGLLVVLPPIGNNAFIWQGDGIVWAQFLSQNSVPVSQGSAVVYCAKP